MKKDILKDLLAKPGKKHLVCFMRKTDIQS